MSDAGDSLRLLGEESRNRAQQWRRRTREKVSQQHTAFSLKYATAQLGLGLDLED